MQAIKEYYLEKLSKAQEDSEACKVVETLINEYFAMIEHMKSTSLYDVFKYEKNFAKNNLEPMKIIAHENEGLKKEVNELRKQLGLTEKYKIRK